ncbi:hypothetical protein H4R18_005367 [Coemansia javaensis]|uniref:Uncharacterized protein n=1 Tax=Coemansia javaensis TaxID=2761396 RepID=A0A9W8LDG2_9FUNG|nr:hypothetical protein H4R18_005367 [Coemansia javaensis]
MKTARMLVVAVAVAAATVAAAPLHHHHRRDGGPTLPLPASGETAGNFLGRLLAPLPVVGSLVAGLGLPPPKHA